MRKAALETLPLVRHYTQLHQVKWFRPIRPIPIVLSRNLKVTLKPIGVANVDGKSLILAGQVWKNLSLSPFEFRLWASMLKVGVLDNNPDLEGFHWLEMSAPKVGAERELSVRSIEAVDLLGDDEFRLVINNIEQAMKIVADVPKQKRDKRPDPKQGNFFE
ncbi:MAG: hypothetical protein AAF719_06440 [Pseudomonadota bacterium]